MIFKIIFTIITFISLIAVMYNVIVGVRINDKKLTVLCGLGSGIIGIILGVLLSSLLL